MLASSQNSPCCCHEMIFCVFCFLVDCKPSEGCLYIRHLGSQWRTWNNDLSDLPGSFWNQAFKQWLFKWMSPGALPDTSDLRLYFWAPVYLVLWERLTVLWYNCWWQNKTSWLLASLPCALASFQVRGKCSTFLSGAASFAVMFMTTDPLFCMTTVQHASVR